MIENKLEIVSYDEKSKMLQNAIYQLLNKEAFYGGLLQEINVKYNEVVPTAGITFNQKTSCYEMYINPYFFKSLSLTERPAVLQHEILHFTNKHLFRAPFLVDSVSNEDKKLYNIAGDMAINQFIDNLPKGSVNVADWKLDSGQPFPKYQSMESYFELIKKEQEQQKQNKQTEGNVEEQLEMFKEFDQHFWDSLDEETKKKMLEEAKKIVQRTVEKTRNTSSKIPDSVQDLLTEIDVLTNGLNYKQLLKSVIRRTVSCTDRENTWKKPNKRYGSYSPGTRVGALPQCSFYLDTSGSISIIELNQFLNVMSGFLKVGSRTCSLNLWHTKLYLKKKYRLHSEIDKSSIQYGGTDVECVLEDIKKSNPNLSIILTDGYYETSSIKNTSEIIWIISEGGNKDHPMKNVGKTIMLEDLK